MHHANATLTAAHASPGPVCAPHPGRALEALTRAYGYYQQDVLISEALGAAAADVRNATARTLALARDSECNRWLRTDAIATMRRAASQSHPTV